MKSFIMVAMGAALWGCWSLFLRPAGFSGPQSAFISLALMALPAPFFFQREALRDRRATVALGVLSLCDAANAALFFAAVQRGPVAVAVLTHYLAPLLIALAAPWVLRERPSPRALIGAPLTLVGLALLLGAPQQGLSDTRTALLGGASALFFAANVLAIKEASRAYSPMAINCLHAPLSALVLLCVFGREALPAAVDSRLLWVAGGALLCGIVGNSIFTVGLRRVPAAAGSALTYLEPLTAALVGWVVFGEALGPMGLVGGVLVLGTGVWVARASRAQPSSAPEAPGLG
ncbi:MAG: EamA family transporter [Cystobacter sp.]